MPVVLPSPADELLTAPDADEVAMLARGMTSAIAPDGGLTSLQQLLMSALVRAMTGFAVETRDLAPVDAAEFAKSLAARNLAFRTRIVQNMILGELILEPLPASVATRVREFAAELCVDDEMISVAESYAEGALDVAAADFARNGYLAAVDPDRLRAVHADALSQAWAAITADPALAAQWTALETLPVGSLGRGVADFYRDRGFVYPGLPGSAPPLLAQHDWVHVLAGYGTTLENELEVFAFIARANDDPRGFSLLAMIVSLFETGNLACGAGRFEASPGHLRDAGMAVRLADAMRRGALVRGSQDFLGVDWFTLADRQVADVRSDFGVADKSPDALAAGSRGSWEDGGITAYQLNASREAAEQAGRPYIAWKPDPERT
jgi:hypothetical protein